MASISYMQFIELTIQWAQERNAQFKFNWPVKGGWEGWIQVDLTGYILARDSTAEILREQRIFPNSKKRVDLLLNTTAELDHLIPVEIKAESLENPAYNFLNGIYEDLAKLALLRGTNLSQCTRMMMAVPFNPESLAAVLAIQENGHPIFHPIFNNGEIAIAIAVHTKVNGWLLSKELAATTPMPTSISKPVNAPPSKQSAR